MPVYNWSQTAATNATADATVNWAEGMAPSAVNDSARAMMASIAKWRDDTNGSLVTGGTSTAFTVTTNSVYDTLAHLSGQCLRIRFNNANGASATLNVDGLGAFHIQYNLGNNIPASFIQSDEIWDVVYDNSNTIFRLVSPFAAVIPGTQTAGAFLANNNAGVAGLGYTTGAGGTVTQSTNKSTGVTINHPTGQITTSNSTLSDNSGTSFTVTNSAVSSSDVIAISVQGGVSNTYLIYVSLVSSGSFNIAIYNHSGSSQSDAIVINFAVIKGATS